MTTDIDELLTGWAESERTGDATTMETMLSDDFVGIGPVGFVLDRQGWLGRFAHGLRYERLDLDEVSTHRHGDTAIVVAHQHAVGDAGGNPTPPDLRVSFTIVRDDGTGLRIAGMQYSFIGPPPGAGR
jgi:ketosteroid isomerase-like protein